MKTKSSGRQKGQTKTAPTVGSLEATRAMTPSQNQGNAFGALLPWAGLALLALAAYLPALKAGFIWDDEALTENPLVTTASGLWGIWATPYLMSQEQHYWPMVYSSFWLEHLFFGLRPFVYHFNNIMLHGAVCILLWRVLRRLAVPGAWLAAALFAVHPVHAESVAWVIERKDVLSGAFYFGATLAFLRFHETDDAEPKRWRWYGLALALFVAAMLSKSIAVTLPLALGLAIWVKRGRLSARDLMALAPLALAAAVITAIDLAYTFNHQQSGLAGDNLALPERIMAAGRALWVYLSKLAWPHPLATFYPKWPVGMNLLSALPLIAWLGLLAGLWLAHRRIGRGAFAAFAFFSFTLAPTLGVIEFKFLHFSWVADRFQYLASAGPLALAAAGLATLAKRMSWPENARRYGAIALIALLGMLCLNQARRYRDSVALFSANAAAYPECWSAHSNLGWALLKTGRGEEAIEAIKGGLQRLPQPDCNLTLALAQALAQQRPGEAEPYFKMTLQLKPDFVAARINYGAFLSSQGKLDEAATQYHEALQTKPDDVVALSNLGSILNQQRKFTKAEQVLSRAVQLEPTFSDAHGNLGHTLFNLKKLPQALEEGRKALQLDPGCINGYLTIGRVMLVQGNGSEAAAHLEQAMRLKPAVDTVFLLGQAYELLGDTASAARCYQEGLKRRPDSPQAIQRLKALGVEPEPNGKP